MESKKQAMKELMPYIQKVLNKMEAGAAAKPEGQEKTINGLPVSHRKCMMRACIKKEADGTCGAAVISCGSENGDQPEAADQTSLKKKDAVKLAKKSMKNLIPFIKQ